MRVFIVEDEDAIREGLEKLIDWKAEGFNEVIGCNSAMKALEILEKQYADLIITDIFMPVITGLEFVKIAKKQCPIARFVILTGHERFEYAQEAIELGVQRYILKPILPDNLISVIRDIRKEIIEERNIKNWIEIAGQKLNEYMPIVVNRFWNDILNGKLQDQQKIINRAKMAEINIGFDKYICLATRVLNPNNIVVPLPHMVAVHQIIEEMLKDRLLYILEYENGIQQAVLYRRVEDKILDNLRLSIETNLGLNVCFGVGRECNELSCLYQSAEDAQEAVKSVHNIEKQVIVRYEDISLWKKEQVQYPYVLEKEILDMLNFREQLDEKLVHRFAEEVLPPKSSAKNAQLMILQFMVAVYRYANDYSLTMPSFKEAEERLQIFDCTEKYLLELLRNVMEQKNQSHKRIVLTMVEGAKQIIAAEYANPELSVTSIAKQLCVTPNYLSRIFHNQTGENCLEYITSVRMEAAKEFLLHSSIKSYEIALQVGYNNPNYFSALFKRLTGTSPKEFRRQGEV